MNRLTRGIVTIASNTRFSVLNMAQRNASNRFMASVATVEKSEVPSGDGDRLVVQDAGGNPILVAKVGTQLFAVENNCPHMNKSFEKGKIFSEGTEPEIRCAFHNSRFNLKTGMCTKWVTGALGYDNKLIGGVAQKIGGEKRDLKAYKVIENDDGSLTVDDGV